MNQNLYNLLSTFSQDEWQGFNDFIESKYFSKGRNYSKILSILKKYIFVDKNSESLNINVFNKEFGDKMSEQTLHNRLTEINKLAEKFLVYDSLDERSLLYKSELYGVFMERNLLSNFHYNKGLLDNKSRLPDQKDIYFLCNILLLEGHYLGSKGNFSGMYKKYAELSETTVVFILDSILEVATNYQLLKIFNVNCKFELFDDFYQTCNLEAIFNILEKKTNPLFKPILLRYHLYKYTISKDDTEAHNKVIHYFDLNRHSFSRSIKTEYYQKMMSVYVYWNNAGIKKDFRRMFNLLKSRYDDNETLDFKLRTYPANEFRDFILIGLQTKEYDFVEKFIEQYSCQLPDAIRNDEYSLAILNLYMHKKEFLKALHFIGNLGESMYHEHNLDIFRLKIRINYELDRDYKSKTIIEEFKNYLRRTGIGDHHKTANDNFISRYNKLARLKHSQSKNINSRINSFIADNKFTADAGWLKEKAGELLSGFNS